ncbi:C-GCAxxG-C-C family (seleno)protein [Candidatus Formimonas warabiya]|uniref:C_GCAxxG_C_C family protein n=1 Tax=Formimonas warabiya TaxID=1761012 RepID=A0A3G1KUC5_FORW1|nr:C-GCAxxG-C-C family (seleno)protein [Candidatus Formimonas warabiya]ATW26113.1 hypothetical protein DCMF_16230 [Candidatus Formimonas warabiya]
MAQKASEISKEAMHQGRNCCEAVLMAADQIWDLRLPQETLAAAKYFRHGMGSGCSCGALVGLVMVSGILSSRFPHPKGNQLVPDLYKQFVDRFGSSCCRELRRQRTLPQRFFNKGCKQLTGTTAEMLVEAWDQVIRDGKSKSKGSF